MAYKKHTLKYVFNSASGTTLDGTNDTMTVTDMRSICRVTFVAGIGGTQAEVTLYGLSMSTISILSAKGIGAVTSAKVQIQMKIYADDTMIFNGMIYSAYANMNSVPEAGLVISALCGLDISRTASKDFSLKGKASAEEILKSLCTPYGYSVTAYGIDGYYGENPHFTGSPLEQIRQLCYSFKFDFAIQGTEVSVWPHVDGKTSSTIAVVSPENGLIGYPVFTPNGITYQTTFSPLLAIGFRVRISTSIPNMSGQYMNNVVEHYLSSWTKDGPWLTLCQASLIQSEEAS